MGRGKGERKEERKEGGREGGGNGEGREGPGSEGGEVSTSESFSLASPIGPVPRAAPELGKGPIVFTRNTGAHTAPSLPWLLCPWAVSPFYTERLTLTLVGGGCWVSTTWQQ